MTNDFVPDGKAVQVIDDEPFLNDDQFTKQQNSSATGHNESKSEVRLAIFIRLDSERILSSGLWNAMSRLVMFSLKKKNCQ